MRGFFIGFVRKNVESFCLILHCIDNIKVILIIFNEIRVAIPFDPNFELLEIYQLLFVLDQHLVKLKCKLKNIKL